MNAKTLAKIVWNTLNFTTVIFGFALFISISSMIETMLLDKTCLIISAVSIVWIISFILFVRYLNKKVKRI